MSRIPRPITRTITDTRGGGNRWEFLRWPRRTRSKDTLTFSLRGKERKRIREDRFFDLEFFEKRFFNPRRKTACLFSTCFSRTPLREILVRQFSPHGSEAARDTETLLLSFFRPNIEFFPSIDPFILIYLTFSFVSSPPLSITRAVVNRIENDGGSSRSRASLSNLLSSRFAGSKKMTSILFQSKSKSKSKSRKKENKLDCGQRGLFVASTIMIIAFFCFLFLLYFLSLFFFLSLSKGEGGRRTDERPRRPRRRTLRRSSSCLVTPLHPPAPAISSRWPRMAGDRSRQKPRTSCDCRPRSQRRLRSRPRPDTRPSPSILPFSFISLLPSLPYPLLFHALFFVFEILLDSSVSFSSEKIFHDYSFFFFPLVRTTLDLFIRKIYIYM